MFEAFRSLLQTRYPGVFAACAYERVGANGMLLRLEGKSAEGPTVFMAHYDVVPVNESAWRHPPFLGEVHEGELWGRGALDTKCTLMGLMEALEHLLAQGFKPLSDLYLSFGGDEECLGQDASAIVDVLAARGIRPALVLDEGGAVVEKVFPGVSGKAALIGIAEKGSVFADITAQGKSGHASAPPAGQAVAKLSKTLLGIQKRAFPFTLTQPAKELFDTLGRHSTFVYRLIFANLWCFRPLLDVICRKAGGELNALVRTTLAFTRLQGSPAYNVLPQEAKAGLNLRLVPGDSIQKAAAHLQKSVKEKDVTLTLIKGSEPSPVSPASGPAWEKVVSAIRGTYPDALVSPYLMIAASDSRHFCRISGQVYRFSPLPLTREQLRLIHSEDERIPVRLLPDMVRFYIRLMKAC